MSFKLPGDIASRVRIYKARHMRRFSSLVRGCIREWIEKGCPPPPNGVAGGSELVVSSVRLSRSEAVELDSVADRLGISRSMAIRSAIQWCLDTGNAVAIANRDRIRIVYVGLSIPNRRDKKPDSVGEDALEPIADADTMLMQR